MAEKKLTLAEILAKRKEFEEMVAAQIESVTCPLQPYQSVGERSRGLQVN